ncbi:hypothetical protein FNV43_RR13084 [Rhamnella rubrinervis]|uniref:Retrotransposon gag domain-containing protein n=1 Tax=Rhamnella rubrinervis TaxID=2594499 RepID=A0A8K0H0E5_9ROSA|nr:hypothetical protein FNV43_RR13084 [Rhamnella rubrinervis]
MPVPKRPRLSLELTFSQSDIVIELHQAEVETYNSFGKTSQCLGKEVIMQGESSRRMVAPTPVSSSRFGCKEIEASEESLPILIILYDILFVPKMPRGRPRANDTNENNTANLASQLLEALASIRTYNLEENPMLWNHFKELFLEKYFPIMKQDEKEAEFLRLTQGNLSLVEYKRKSDELSRYAPHLVNTEERKARCFEKGLELYNVIAVLRLPTYANVLQRVQLIAKDHNPEMSKTAGQSSTNQRKS